MVTKTFSISRKYTPAAPREDPRRAAFLSRRPETAFLHEHFSFFASEAADTLHILAEGGGGTVEKAVSIVPYRSPNRYRFPLRGTVLVTDTYPSINSHRWCRNSEFAFDAGQFDETLTRPLIAGAPVFAACGGAAIYRKNLFSVIGDFDENHFAYLEDIDIGYRAKISGFANYYEPGAIVYHAGSAVSGSRYNEFKVKLSSKNSIYLIYKNMPILQILLNLPFLTAGIIIKSFFFARKGMGKTYWKGIWEGIRLCCTKEGKKNKVPFRPECLGNYVRIQLELWGNMIRRLTG